MIYSILAAAAAGMELGLSDEEIALRVSEAMAMVGLSMDKFGEKSPFELSGGEKRRAALAGILAMRPKYLVLDEPMAGLDPQGRQSILAMLEKLRQDTGCSIIMVSHSMEDMARLASRLLVISGGRLVADDTPRAVFARRDLLTSIGLDVPEVSKLCAALREKGYPLPPYLYRPEEMRDALLHLWKGEKPC